MNVLHRFGNQLCGFVAIATLALTGCARMDDIQSGAAFAAPSAVSEDESGLAGTLAAPSPYDGTGMWQVHGVDHVGHDIDFSVYLTQQANGDLTGTVRLRGVATVLFSRAGNGIGPTVPYGLSITDGACLNLSSRGLSRLDTHSSTISVHVSGVDSRCNVEPGLDLTFSRS